jgi:hypothetical protein
MGAGLAIFVAVYFGFAFAPGSWAVWPLFAVYGIYIAATEGVARAWVGDQIVDRRAVGTAYGIFFLATAAAALAASVAAGVLWSYVSPRAPFFLGAGAAAAALVLLLAYEAGWRAHKRTVRAALAAATVLAIGGGVAIGIEHRHIASALENEGEPLPAALVRPCSTLPPANPATTSFPRPHDAHYVRVSRKGPTTVVSGWFDGAVRQAHDAYVSALGSGEYLVLHTEVDVADSEVNFSGRSTTGQVKLIQECRSRTVVRVTIRPE